MSEANQKPWLSAYPEGVTWDQTFEPRPVPQIMQDAVARYGNQTCTNFLGKKLTYNEIGALVNSAAAGLAELGVTKGTKVGLFFPNCPTAIIYYYAILQAGGTVVNYNPLYTVEELEFQVRDSETDLMVTLDLKILFDKVEALIQGGSLKKAIVCHFPALLPGLKSTLFKLLKGKELSKPASSPIAGQLHIVNDVLAGQGGFTPPGINPLEDLAVLQYTGGTTGTPKGAMLTHANLNINVQQVMAWAPMMKPGQEKMLGVLPLFHVFAMTGVMNYGLSLGCEIIIMPRFELEGVLKLIKSTKPTIMPGVPTIFNAMLNHPKVQAKAYDLSSLSLCLSGGAPLPLEVKREFERLTGCSLIEAYGLSETSPGATFNPVVGPAKEGSIGQPLPATIVSLRDLEDPTREVPTGEKGEICIKGPQVMKGYWNKPEETANVFIGDYLRTGDVGYMDNEGFTFIVDRLKDLILCSGYNVYPRRIEEAIYAFPGVEEVTVIGIPDDYRGEAPKAFVKMKEGESTTKEEMIEFLTVKISKIEMPSEIEFRDELPKTMIGKLSKKELKQEAGTQA
ncbi:MAG: long-chain-fatty-acid--CoA ligase [Methyloligellaceae bacterium]